MQTTWILTANAGHAHFYQVTEASPPLQEIKTLVNPTASLQTVDTETDKIATRSASKSKHSVGQPTQPSGYQPNQTPSEHYAEIFAREVASFLAESYREGQFEKLIISATPQFLGVLRQLLDASLQNAILAEIDKDYTHFRGKELCELIDARRNAA